MITEADKQQFIDNGYLLIENLVPESLLAAVRATICDYLGMEADDPGSWPAQQSRGHGIVPVHHAQSLWNVRQHPAVHQAFAALHGTEQLWVTSDRVSFKTRDPTATTLGPAEPVHWDGDPGQLSRLSIQGLLYLTDTSEDQGAFCCVPTVYRQLDDHLRAHPEHARNRRPEYDPAWLRVVGGPAGSMVLWNRKLPHSSTLNLSERPRWVQYIAMDPIGDETARQARVAEFEAKMPPRWAVVQQVSGQQLPEPGIPAELTELGRRLAGLDPWRAGNQ